MRRIRYGLLTLGLLTGCAAQQAATVPGSSRHVDQSGSLTTRYRFAEAPIVVFAGATPDPRHNINFHVFVRTSRPLPRDAHGIRPIFLLDDTRPDGVPFTASRKPPCYSSEIAASNALPGSTSLTHPTNGQSMALTMRFPGTDGARIRVRAHQVPPRSVGYDQADATFLRRLGCHPSPERKPSR